MDHFIPWDRFFASLERRYHNASYSKACIVTRETWEADITEETISWLYSRQVTTADAMPWFIRHFRRYFDLVGSAYLVAIEVAVNEHDMRQLLADGTDGVADHCVIHVTPVYAKCEAPAPLGVHCTTHPRNRPVGRSRQDALPPHARDDVVHCGRDGATTWSNYQCGSTYATWGWMPGFQYGSPAGSINTTSSTGTDCWTYAATFAYSDNSR